MNMADAKIIADKVNDLYDGAVEAYDAAHESTTAWATPFYLKSIAKSLLVANLMAMAELSMK